MHGWARLLLNHPTADSVIHVTHEELAAALGVSRVTVSRILGEFAQEGYLQTGYGTIRLLHPKALAAILGFKECFSFVHGPFIILLYDETIKTEAGELIAGEIFPDVLTVPPSPETEAKHQTEPYLTL